LQAGVDLWEAAGWLGMTVEQLEANYGHHHPDFQEEAAEAFGGFRFLRSFVAGVSFRSPLIRQLARKGLGMPPEEEAAR